MGKEKNSKPIIAKVESLGVKILDVLDSDRQEIYIIAQKTGNSGSSVEN
jgi:23S rRNA (cytidine1920-2'-O)/16S rRNA (cytidine1409-2'-O)-methyltransferase